ncbi:MAG: ABC transporter substrate-binding protein [Pirellulaceae bacterium]|nr:ABC transporter substrate-binding protein [Pirellulaceae bacterium]
MNHTRLNHWWCFGLLLFGLIGCSESAVPSKDGVEKVRLQLNWVPEAEHGGFYAALEHGYYEQLGLEVEIIPGGVSAPVTQQLAMNRVQFGVMNADWVVMGRNSGAKIQALMAPIQDSPRCILVRPESGITNFGNFQNITVAAKPEDPFLEFSKRKLVWDQKNVTIVPYLSMQAFFTNQNYAQQGYSFSEPFLAKAQGIDPVVLMVSELGYNPYTSCLVADESLIRSNPTLVRKFVQASIRGWEKYLADPEATNRRIAGLNADQSMESLAFALDDVRKLSHWDAETKQTTLPMGSMTDQRFAEIGQALREIGFISAEDDRVFQRAVNLSFLPDSEAPIAK